MESTSLSICIVVHYKDEMRSRQNRCMVWTTYCAWDVLSPPNLLRYQALVRQPRQKTSDQLAICHMECFWHHFQNSGSGVDKADTNGLLRDAFVGTNLDIKA